jgi:DNA-binding NarL/FixJ family response regulator
MRQRVAEPVVADRRSAASRDRRNRRRGGRRVTDAKGPSPILLMADSHPGALAASSQFLSTHGFRVLEAHNGDEAQRAIRATPPQVILMELTLPGMPASHLAQWFADTASIPQIPVIVLNPIIIAATDFEGRSPSGASTYRPAGMLVKPVPPPAMLEEVRRVLRSTPAGSL